MHSFQKADAGGQKGAPKSWPMQAASALIRRVTQRFQALGGRDLKCAPDVVKQACSKIHSRVIHKRPNQLGSGMCSWLAEKLKAGGGSRRKEFVAEWNAMPAAETTNKLARQP